MPEEKSDFRAGLKWVIFIASVVAGIMLAYADLKQDIALLRERINNIQNNDLHSISKDMKELQDKNKLQDDFLHEIDKKVDRVLILLEEK